MKYYVVDAFTSFCPELNMEDPVTGFTHNTLIPLWSRKLNKDK